MESVEVWMWAIAGLIIAGIVFIGGFKLIQNYVDNVEESQLSNSFNLLYSSATNVCYGGSNSREVKNLKFPYITKKIYAQDKAGFEEYGTELCYITKDAKNCADIELCNLSMSTLNLDEDTGVLYNIQKFLGKKRVAQIKFDIERVSYGEVKIDWEKQVVR